MKTAELRALSKDELKQQLDDLREELANLRIQKATHQLTNPSRIRIVRKDIARTMTLIREVELSINKVKES